MFYIWYLWLFKVQPCLDTLKGIQFFLFSFLFMCSHVTKKMRTEILKRSICYLWIEVWVHFRLHVKASAQAEITLLERMRESQNFGKLLSRTFWWQCCTKRTKSTTCNWSKTVLWCCVLYLKFEYGKEILFIKKKENL